MYKNYTLIRCRKLFRVKSKLFLYMKLSFVILLCSILQIRAKTLAQTVSLNKKNIPLLEALNNIHQQSGYSFMYDESLLSKAGNVAVQFENVSVKEALNVCFKNQPFTYVINNQTILITPKPEAKATSLAKKDIEIKGTIIDEKSLPIPGAAVKLKAGGKVTLTDIDGKYAINVPDGNSIIIVSFVGYTSQEISVNNRNVIDVQLKQAANQLNDVVVVGYGTQKRITTTGAISTINADDIKLPVANLTNVIAGRVAGIIGVQRSGQPGYDNSEIYIRGISTFTSSSPLILVDGVERSFSNIDPEDIASFSILKDASATAVYGVRGANGVIIIETKKGKQGKPLINAQYDQGITQFTSIPKFADGVTYMNIANEAYKSSFPNGTAPYSADRIAKTASSEDPDLYPNVDWFSELFNKTGQNRRARVNANGGSENAQYYLSVGYYDEDGLYKTDGLSSYNSAIKFTRYNFTSNLTLNITKTTKVDFGASGWLSDANYPGSSVDAIWGSAYLMPPISIPKVYSNGLNPQIRTGSILNPYALLTQTGYATEFKSQLWSNIRVRQDLDAILKGLSASAMFSFDNYNSHTINRTKTVDGYLATGRDADGNLLLDKTSIGTSFLDYKRTNGGTRQFYTEAKINYDRTFKKHNVTGLLLFNQQDNEDGFAGTFIESIPFRYMGLASRGTYSYDNKYLAEVNLGYNGSETFAPGKRFGFFPAVSAGWILSEEKFFKPLKDIFPFFKIRYSYGEVGNSSIGGGRRFGYISTVANHGDYSFGIGRDNNYTGLDIEAYAVDVTWETAKKHNLGIELNMLKQDLSITVDLFREIREAIYRQRGDVPTYAGILNLPYANLGEVHNKGIDGNIDYHKKIGDWQVGLKGNLTWTRSIIINDANAPWPYPWQQQIGQKIGKRHGYISLGLFTSDEEVANSPYQTGTNKAGDIKYKDLNGDGKINGFDQAAIGYGSIPEIVYGFGPTVYYKGFAVSAWFKGISNVDIRINGDGLQPFSQGGEYGNLLAQVTDRWTPENQATNPMYPRLTYGNDNMNYVESDWWKRNGAFLRLQTAQLSYDFKGAKWLSRTGMSNLNLYFIGYNLFTVSDFKLWDVELGDGRGSQYPLLKTYNFGVKLTFK